MKLMWLGSDVMFANIKEAIKHSKKSKIIYMLGLRIFALIADKFVQAHIVVSGHLKDELKPLKLRKPFEVLIDPPFYPNKIKKIKHNGFNILYYRTKGSNQRFKDWVYGYDIYVKIKKIFPKLNFIEINGENDMAKIYPIIDFYLRPNRHDGHPRMVDECIINKIPYYASKANPDINDIIKKIKNEISLSQT